MSAGVTKHPSESRPTNFRRYFRCLNFKNLSKYTDVDTRSQTGVKGRFFSLFCKKKSLKEISI